MIPVLLLGLLAEGIGHMIGYAAGPGDCIEKVTKYEFDRLKHLESMEQETSTLHI